MCPPAPPLPRNPVHVCPSSWLLCPPLPYNPCLATLDYCLRLSLATLHICFPALDCNPLHLSPYVYICLPALDASALQPFMCLPHICFPALDCLAILCLPALGCCVRLSLAILDRCLPTLDSCLRLSLATLHICFPALDCFALQSFTFVPLYLHLSPTSGLLCQPLPCNPLHLSPSSGLLCAPLPCNALHLSPSSGLLCPPLPCNPLRCVCHPALGCCVRLSLAILYICLPACLYMCLPTLDSCLRLSLATLHICFPALDCSALQSFTFVSLYLHLSPTSGLLCPCLPCNPLNIFKLSPCVYMFSQLWTAVSASALQCFVHQLWASQTLVGDRVPVPGAGAGVVSWLCACCRLFRF